MPVSTTGRPAAVLSILVTADTRAARANIAALDRQLAYSVKRAGAGSVALQRAAVGMKYAGVGLAAGLAGSVAAAVSFEQEFANVKKTVQATPKEFEKVRKGILDLSTVVPASANELADLAGEAGALGIKAKDLVSFTKTAAELGTATNLSAEAAGTALARLGNIMRQKTTKDFHRMGSVLVDLGNKGASTEEEISAMALRLAGAGRQVGLTAAQVEGLSAAMANIGIRSEMGGSAMGRVLLAMQAAIAANGAELRVWAKTAGMSAQQFADAFEKDPTTAITDFTEGLDKIRASGGDVTATLNELGKQAHTSMNEIRVRQVLLGLAGAQGEVAKTQSIANTEWKQNNALTTEFQQRQKTLASQMTLLKNNIMRVAIDIGTQLMPNIRTMVETLSNPKLTLDEKVKDIVGQIGDLLEQVVKVAGPIGGKIMEALVVGMVKAWWQSDLLGKLFIGASFIRLIGGPGALGKLGVYLGTRIGAAMGITMAAESVGTAAATAGGASVAGAAAGTAGGVAAGSAGGAAAATGGTVAGTAGVAAGAGSVGGLGVAPAVIAPEVGLGTLGAVLAPAAALGVGLGLLNDHLNKVRDAVEKVPWSGMADSLKKSTHATKEFRKAAKQVKPAIQEWNQAHKAEAKSSEKVTHRQHQLTKAVEQYGPKSRQAKQAEERLSDARREHRKTADRARVAEVKLADKEHQAKDTQATLIQSIQGLIENQRKKLRFDVKSYNLDKKAQVPRKVLIQDLFSIQTDQKNLQGSTQKLSHLQQRFFGVVDQGQEKAHALSVALKDNATKFKQVNPFIDSTIDKTLHYGNVTKDTSVKGVKSIDNLKTGTDKGMDEIDRRVTTSLTALGIKNPAQFGINSGSGNSSNPPKKQRGGKVATVPGHTGGDRHVLSLGGHPIARVESEENVYVGNRTMSNTLDSLNMHIPRKAGGGSVTGDTQGLVPPFMSALSRMSGSTGTGIFVNSGYRSYQEQVALYNAYLNGTGNLAAKPGSSHHELGIAADISPGSERFGGVAGKFGMGFTVPGESWHIELLNAALGRAGGSTFTWKEIQRVLMTGPKGSLRSTGQGALDTVVKAANQMGRKKAAAMGGTGSNMFPAGAGVLSRGEMRKLMKAHGMPDIFGWIALAESGFNPAAHNPSGASGLWQIMMPLNAGVVHGNVFDPDVNADAAMALSGGGHNLAPWAASQGGWGSHVGQSFKKGGLAWGGWHGKGGQVTANRPTLIGIGDRGRETADITPGGPRGGDVHVHTHTYIEGDMAALIDVIRTEIDDGFIDDDDFKNRLGKAGM